MQELRHKNRSAVRGGGIKPWRQKGTGRARAGTIRSPYGGKVVLHLLHSRVVTIRKLIKRCTEAHCAILSELIRTERFIVIESLTLEAIETKDFLKKLETLKIADNERVLMITDAVDENLYLASRNLPMVDLRDVAAVDPVSLVGAESSNHCNRSEVARWCRDGDARRQYKDGCHADSTDCDGRRFALCYSRRRSHSGCRSCC